jgi:diguanylate cyclase (GGDEF)-like protein
MYGTAQHPVPDADDRCKMSLLNTTGAVVAFRRVPRVLAWLVIASGFVVLVGGWMLDLRELRSIIPGAVGMKPLTAVALVAGAAALLLLEDPHEARRRRVAGRLVALVPGVIGTLVLAQYIFGVTIGIDELLFTDADGRASGIAYPGRIAPTTAACSLLLTLSLLLLDAKPRRGWRPSEVPLLPLALVAVMSLIGYAYSIPAFYGPGAAAKMAVNTAGLFVLLAVAVVLVRPHGWLMRLGTTRDPGGVMARRLAPMVLLMPLLLGWLHLRTTEWGLFDARWGAWWLSVATMAGLVWMISWCAQSLSRADGERRELERQLFRLASHDSLTGLYNRHRFDEELGRFAAHHRRYGGEAALLLLDLDGLKAVNDRLGHQAGDQLIRAVADTLSKRLRSTDFLARLGGDEFAVLLPQTSPEHARLVAAEMVGAVSAVRTETATGLGGTTASCGVVSLEPGGERDLVTLVGLADAAMYEAKRAGGHRFVVAGDRRPGAARPALHAAL